MGTLVDTVSEVLDIGDEEIEDAPEFGAGFDAGFILGIAKAKGTIKILPNIEEVLTAADIEMVSRTSSTSTSEVVETADQP